MKKLKWGDKVIVSRIEIGKRNWNHAELKKDTTGIFIKSCRNEIMVIRQNCSAPMWFNKYWWKLTK